MHTIAIQVPISQLTQDGKKPIDATSSKSVLGIWGAASRQKVTLLDHGNGNGKHTSGPWTQAVCDVRNG